MLSCGREKREEMDKERKIILGGLALLIFVLPFPLHTATWESLGLSISLLTWIYGLLRKKGKFSFHGLGLPLLAWWGIVLFSSLHSANPSYSFHEVKDEILKQTLLFLLVVNALRSEDSRFLLYPFLLSNFFVSLFTLYGFFSGILTEYGRATGTYLSYSRTAMYYIFALPLLYTVLLSYPDKRLRRISLFLFLLSLLSLTLTFTRGAWLVTFFSLLFLSLRKNPRLCLLLTGGVLILLLFAPVRERVRESLQFKRGMNAILSQRVGLWKNALIIIRDNPVSGVGYGPNIFRYIKDKYDVTNRVSRDQQPDAHNLYLQIAVETGLTGISIFLFLLFSFWRRILPKVKRLQEGWNRELLYGVLTALGAILLYGLVGYFYEDRNGLFFWLYISWAILLTKEEKDEKN